MTLRSWRGRLAIAAAGLAVAAAVGVVAVLEADEQPRDRYESVVRADRPVAYWRLGEQTGRTGADLAGGNDPATFDGPLLVSAGAIDGSTNTGIGFDGVDDYAELGRRRFGFPGRSPFTLEAWVRPTTPPDGQPQARIFTKEYADSRGRRSGYAISIQGRVGIAFERLRRGKVQAVRAPVTLPVGEYSHVVATFDGSRSVLYVDGEVAAGANNERAVRIPEHNIPLTLARALQIPVRRYWGLIDEVAIYDRALTDTEVREHFAAAR